MIQQERISKLNSLPTNTDGSYVLYWMQQSQRTVDNHALEYAVERAAERKLPLICWFGLTSSFPDANIRHYYFMLQGFRDVSVELAKRGIPARVIFLRVSITALRTPDHEEILWNATTNLLWGCHVYLYYRVVTGEHLLPADFDKESDDDPPTTVVKRQHSHFPSFHPHRSQ